MPQQKKKEKKARLCACACACHQNTVNGDTQNAKQKFVFKRSLCEACKAE